MTGKADFNAEEWSLLREAPPLAGMIVATAQRGGTLRESVSMARAYGEARQDHGESELVGEIVNAGPEVDVGRYGSAEELRQQGMQQLRDAVATLEAKGTPEDVDAYKRFVMTVAEKAAEAHKEGGFLGVGGKEVSESEQGALDEIATALGVERS